MWRSAVQLCLGLHRVPPDAASVFHGGLAQLARAPALQAGGQRFESVILHSGILCCGRCRGWNEDPRVLWHIGKRKARTCKSPRPVKAGREKIEIRFHKRSAESIRTYDGLPQTCHPCGARVAGDESVRAMKEVGKGEWRMPRLLQAMKDVISCDKPR